MAMEPNYMKKKARSAYKDYTAPYKRDEDEDKPIEDFRAAPDNEDDGGTDEPADVVGLAKKSDEKKKDSGWGKKVAAAIAGTIGAVAGANLQHKNNERRRKMYEAKRKTGNYL